MWLYNTIVLKQASWLYFTICVIVGGGSAKQTYFFMKQHGICKKKKVLTAIELSQKTKEVVDFWQGPYEGNCARECFLI